MTKSDVERNEQALLKIYMELMGTSEVHARSVLMYVQPSNELAAEQSTPADAKES